MRCAARGVSAADVIVGHTCGSKEPAYRRSLVERGAFVGFDRFGFAPANTDENRVEALIELVRSGFGGRIVVSHDCVLCYRGVDALLPARRDFMLFERKIAPMLRERGVADHEIDRLTVENPRRFFEGGP